MKRYILLLFCIFISCSKKVEEKQVDKTYFEFDEITQYYFPYTDEQLAEIWEKENQSRNEKDLLDLLTYDSPETINDSNFIKRVENLNPEISQIEASDFEKIRPIFSERKRKNDDESSACKTLYRNILIFKNDGKVTGITKLCFSCERVHIVGTNRNTENFGQAGDWEKLRKLIYKRPTANSSL